MNLDRAEERARSVTTMHQAAHLYYDVESELALGENTDEQEQAGESALSTLRSRFPGVENEAGEIETPPRLSHAAGRNVSHDPGERDGGERHTQRRRPARTGGTRRPAGGAPAGRRTSTRSYASRATGISGGGATDAALLGIRTILGAGLVYFLLGNRGSGAFADVLGTLGNGVQRLIKPVDIFSTTGPNAADKALAQYQTTVNPNNVQPGSRLRDVAPGVTSPTAYPRGMIDIPGGLLGYAPTHYPGVRVLPSAPPPKPKTLHRLGTGKNLGDALFNVPFAIGGIGGYY